MINLKIKGNQKRTTFPALCGSACPVGLHKDGKGYFKLIANNSLQTMASRHSGRGLLLLAILLFSTLTPSYSQSTIKVGFLIRDKNDIAVQQAAELAIQDANAEGGYKGQKFELATKSCDGPWGIGSKQAVALIYEDQVPIVVTALDGRNAHLAEQVTAKSHVVMLSTLSSDPTLSRAYVPWYFRMVPDDRQQAEALARQIYQVDKAKKVALIALDSYDGQKSVEAFVEEANEMGVPKPEIFTGLKEKGLLEKININHWDVVVLAGYSDEHVSIINQIRDAQIYAFLNITNFTNELQPENYQRVGFVNKNLFKNEAWESFSIRYHQKFHTNPVPSLAYVYDGIILATESIKKFGPDPEAIRTGFRNIKNQGLTGSIEFGKLGNRELDLSLE
jgi:branched-chain amino acid transport system substrate-binding protein